MLDTGPADRAPTPAEARRRRSRTPRSPTPRSPTPRSPTPQKRMEAAMVMSPPKPGEGSWTQHYPELGTGPISYEDSISTEFYELEREAIFKRTWLNVGRVEQLPRNGS